jgi:carbon monoxide dehydrogenase subunit G
VRIEGVYTYAASRELVWSLLHDPVTIRQSLPGCDEFDQIAASVYVAALHIQRGPFKGQYRGQLKLMGYELHGRSDFTLEGEGPEGIVLGSGTVSLNEQDGSTTVQYVGDVDFAGITAMESPRMLKTTANALIRQFFEAIDRQVRIQTGIHTTSLDGQLPRTHYSDTIDLQDVAAKIKQDRQTTWLVLALVAFVFLTLSGAFMILLLMIRWGKRIFDRRVATSVYAKQHEIDPLELT